MPLLVVLAVFVALSGGMAYAEADKASGAWWVFGLGTALGLWLGFK